MGKASQKDQSPVRVDAVLSEFGFNPEAPESTARALVLNMIRSAYGPEAAKEAFLRMNSTTTRQAIRDLSAPQSEPEQQLSFFDSDFGKSNSA